MRLRSILRSRIASRQRSGHVDAIIRWPNAYFAEQGLFSLVTAHAPGRSILSEVKPSTGEPDAGNPPVRFGGRGDRTQSVLPSGMAVSRHALNGTF